MPLFLNKEIKKGSRLVIWKVSEGTDALPADRAFQVLQTPSESRKTELIGEYLLSKEVGLLGKIKYLENGKPVLDEGHISISHGLDLVGYLISDEPAGLDIQKPVIKIDRIKHRFCRDTELEQVAACDTPLEMLTLIWSTKEAIFKIYGQNLPFAEGMYVEHVPPAPSELEEGKLQCQVFDGQTFGLEYFKIGDQMVVYTSGKLENWK